MRYTPVRSRTLRASAQSPNSIACVDGRDDIDESDEEEERDDEIDSLLWVEESKHVA